MHCPHLALSHYKATMEIEPSWVLGGSKRVSEHVADAEHSFGGAALRDPCGPQRHRSLRPPTHALRGHEARWSVCCESTLRLAQERGEDPVCPWYYMLHIQDSMASIARIFWNLYRKSFVQLIGIKSYIGKP